MAGSGRRSARSRIKSSPDTADGDSLSSRPNLKLLRDRTRHRSSIGILNVNWKYLLAILVISSVIIYYFIDHLVFRNEGNPIPRVITPFPAPKIMDLPQFQGEHKESLYWGTYRPHIYLGIRARTPRSLLGGLMWIGIKDGRYSMRHVCQDGDELSTYGWLSHNGRDFGYQVIDDHGMALETSFLKEKNEGSGYGGDWAVRLGVQSPRSTWNGENAHLFFYMADEEWNAIALGGDTFRTHDSSLLASGSRMDVENWQLHLKSRDDLELHYSGFRTPHMHNLSELVLENLGSQARQYGQLKLSDTSDESPNVMVFQISGKIPFTTDIAFLSGSGSESSRVKERLSSLTDSSLTNRLEEKQAEFDNKFEKKFSQANKLDLESITVGKAAIGNLLGGIGYFYGQSKIFVPEDAALHNHDNTLLYWPAELYTAVPSRPFFPRGFLWDEGFHQLMIRQWDIHICLDILGHWLDLMNIDGWIPREQILGAEALSKVPQEFVPQHPSNGNPPTLFLVIRDLIEDMGKNRFTVAESNEISTFLERAFNRLEAWFQWFNTTQSGKEMGSYYWHGRDGTTTRELNPKALSSGLDDYPRASHPNEEERHLDLRCWMLLAAECMHSIARLFNKEDQSVEAFETTVKLLSDFEFLNQMHFDADHGAYFDFGNHTEKVRLHWKEVMVEGQYPTRELVREVLERPILRLVPHIGYVSLFPLIRRMIPADSPILEKQLDLISNKSILWTDYGLRSLAKTSTLYMKRNTEHDPPYWRGPIWMNFNYLILSALHHYSKEDGPYRDRTKTIYSNLRSNLIRNVVHNYNQTGFLWEQYDQMKGKGKGARVFTGWTALILLIMSESYGGS